MPFEHPVDATSNKSKANLSHLPPSAIYVQLVTGIWRPLGFVISMEKISDVCQDSRCRFGRPVHQHVDGTEKVLCCDFEVVVLPCLLGPGKQTDVRVAKRD